MYPLSSQIGNAEAIPFLVFSVPRGSVKLLRDLAREPLHRSWDFSTIKEFGLACPSHPFSTSQDSRASAPEDQEIEVWQQNVIG